MELKHTPGPWKAKRRATYPEPGWVLLWPDQGGTHMRRLDYQGNFTAADAALLAAAPALLAALIVLRRRHQIDEPHHADLCEFCQLADAAIAQATRHPA